MISPDEALELVIHAAAPLAARSVALEDAYGLVLAEKIPADRDYPPFERSMMDGFAVRLADAGRTVVRVGEVAAGSVWDGEVAAGQCIEILTGAPCPAGAEAVVPKENVQRNEDSIALPTSIKPGQHIAPQGSDCRAGQCVLTAGATVTSMSVGVLATFGRDRVLVTPRPSLGIITTGAELARPGEPLLPGHIRNSNGPMLAAMARNLGLIPPRQWHAADDVNAIMAALEEASDLDIVVLAGGVSVGTYDFVPEALARLGAETLFHGVNQKPGKPILFARRDKMGIGPICQEGPQGAAHKLDLSPFYRPQLVFGLPGNPLSCHFGFHRYVSAAVRKMSGRAATKVCRGALAQAIELKGGRVRYMPAIAEADLDQAAPWRISILPEQSSADIFQCCRANCYVELPPPARVYQAGEVLAFTLLAEAG